MSVDRTQLAIFLVALSLVMMSVLLIFQHG